MSSQMSFPTGTNYEGLKLMLAATVCKNIEISVQQSTSKSFWSKDKFDSEKFCRYYSEDTNNLAPGLLQLTPTERRAYEVIWKKALSLFNENNHYKKIVPSIMEAERITDLTKSKVIQVTSIAILQECILESPERSFICEAKYLKLWV